MGKFDGILLASDFDGTLVWQSHTPSEENIKAINYFIENGGLFTVSTGRTYEFIKKLNLPINAPLITINGTCINDYDKILKTFTFSAEQLSEELFNSDNLQHTFVFSPENECNFPILTQSEINQINEPICKIVFCFSDEESAISFQNKFSKKYSSEFVFERSWPVGVEMLSKKGGKGTCLNIIKEMTNSRITIAAGDFENDISMLKAADISYAPENALDSVKKIANRKGVHCKDNLIEYIINNI
ncbi:MAG: HAD-IIB family hydrolase [Clostridia bacterium]|nr:HAD-IIB family hydrolase [Clostridia bacterium]